MSNEPPLTKKEFEALSPHDRGYAAYMAGCRDDQPNIPNECNPYRPGSAEAKAWLNGQRLAAQEVQGAL